MSGLKVDYRLGGKPRYYLAEENEKYMMSLPPEIKKCVAFLAYNAVGGSRLAGTVFFVSVPMETVEGRLFIYLVTAKHVIEKIKQNTMDNKVYIRLNTRTDASDYAASDINQWKYHQTDTSVDVAVLPWAPPQNIDYLSIPRSMALTDEIIKKENISIGDEVFLTGLFSTHYGKKKNLPIVRVGNIAMMPEEKVYTDSLGEIDAYLIESRSIGGLSGSPVFVYLGNMRPKNGNIQIGGQSQLFYWLGLMHGHWDISSKKVDVATEDEATIEKVNMGIAIVIPTSKILEIIDCDEFKAIRKQREEEIKKETAHVPLKVSAN